MCHALQSCVTASLLLALNFLCCLALETVQLPILGLMLAGCGRWMKFGWSLRRRSRRPVFSIPLDTEVVSFLWLIDLGLRNVAVAERGLGQSICIEVDSPPKRTIIAARMLYRFAVVDDYMIAQVYRYRIGKVCPKTNLSCWCLFWQNERLNDFVRSCQMIKRGDDLM